MDNLSLVKQLYNNFNTGNIPAVLEAIDDNAEWLIHGSPEIPPSGHIFGKTNILVFFGVIASSMEILSNDFKEYIVNGSQIITIGEASSIVHSTKKKYTTVFIDRLDMKEGKVIKFERLMNTVVLYKAFLP